MSTYVLNKREQSNGDHEVHNLETCPCLPDPEDQIMLGRFESCSGAIRAASNLYPKWRIDGCYYCCNECHTR